MENEIVGRCWRCGRELKKYDFNRENTCPDCHKSTRVCRNCRFFEPGRANDCSEPVAERILDKEKANYCDFFQPSDKYTGDADSTSQEILRQAAADLFK